MAKNLIKRFGWRIRDEAKWRAHDRASHGGPFILCAACWPSEVS